MNIVFDLGGVLFGWSPHRLVARMLPAHAPDEPTALALSAALFENFGGQWAEFDRGVVEPGLLADGIARRTGLSAAQARSVIDAVPDELQAIPEMLDLLERLRAQGHALYFLSNMPAPYVDALLPRHDFLREFAAGVFSSQVCLIKPEAAIYAHALKAFGIEAGDTLFIDDVAANAQAARDAGWQALHFIDPVQCKADLVELGALNPLDNRRHVDQPPG